MDTTFFTNLDSLYQYGKMAKAEEYLFSCLTAAEHEQNISNEITVLNEIIGFYRVQGNFKLCRQHCDKLLSFIQVPEWEGTLPYATVLLNVANACRVMGSYEEAKEYFFEVQRIYSESLPENDYRLASLYNNFSLLYQSEKEYQEAIDAMEKALLIIHRIPGAFIEEASTYTNLANVLLECGQTEDVLNALQIALRLFEQNGMTGDIHYSATLSAMAHAHYRAENYSDALTCYQKAADIMESLSGKTRNYAAIYKNMANVYTKLGRPDDAKKALATAWQVTQSLSL